MRPSHACVCTPRQSVEVPRRLMHRAREVWTDTQSVTDSGACIFLLLYLFKESPMDDKS